MSQSCLDCTQRSDRVFCDLTPAALAMFDGIKSAQMLPKGTVLFREGQAARSVFLLCEGRVRLTVCAEDGSRLTLRTVTAGEMLGLSASLAGTEYEVTAEAMDKLQVAVVTRKNLLRFLRQHREACMHVVNLLSEDLHIAYGRVRSVGLGRVRRAHASEVD